MSAVLIYTFCLPSPDRRRPAVPNSILSPTSFAMASHLACSECSQRFVLTCKAQAQLRGTYIWLVTPPHPPRFELTKCAGANLQIRRKMMGLEP